MNWADVSTMNGTDLYLTCHVFRATAMRSRVELGRYATSLRSCPAGHAGPSGRTRQIPPSRLELAVAANVFA